MKLFIRLTAIVFLSLVVAFILLRNFCPASGLGLTRERREFHKLKNRAALPQRMQFNSQVTLETLLQPGDDRARWSESNAAIVEGYVVSVTPGPFEAANCFCDRDVHVMIASRPDAPPREQVVLEVTPRIETKPENNSLPSGGLKDWSRETLARELIGHRVRFEGWLLFDGAHAGEAENTAPGRPNNWRATAWEIHPISKIQIVH